MAEDVVVSLESRYKDTPWYDDQDGLGPQFGLLEIPIEFGEGFDPEEAWRHEVTLFEVGFLDIIAANYYGAGSEPLWWVIALANGIVDMEAEMYPGQILLIPTYTAIVSFMGRGQVE